MTSSPLSANRALLALAALVLLALGARLHGLDSGLPAAPEPDAKLVYQLEVRRGPPRSEEVRRRAVWYPDLIGRLGALLPVDEEAEPGAPLESHLAAAGATHLRMRLTVALLSLLAIPATYLLARRFLGAGASLFAAALGATSLLHLSFSQQGRPHAVSAATFAFAVLGAIHLVRRGTWDAFALAGLAAGAAVGTLQSGVATLLPLALALFLRARATGRRLDPRALLALAPVAFAFLFFYGSSDAQGPGELGLDRQRGLLFISHHVVVLADLNGGGFPILLRSLWTYDPVITALAAAGIPLLALRRARLDDGRGARAELALMLAFALPYLLVNGIYARTYERFALPLVPFLAVLAAAGLQRAVGLGRARATPALGALGALAILALPTYACWRLSVARAAPTTQDQAAAWLRERLPDPGGAVLLSPTLDLPLVRARAGLPLPFRDPEVEPLHLPWVRYQQRAAVDDLPGPDYPLGWIPLGDPATFAAAVEDPTAFVESWSGAYAVIEVFDRRAHPAGTRLREGLRARARRVARFTPDSDDGYSEHPFTYYDENTVPPPAFLWRLLQAERCGPVIEVYDLASPPAAGGDPGSDSGGD